MFRIQALGVTDPMSGDVVGGTISSNITAYVRNDFDSTWGDGFEPIGLCAIKVIAAGNAITGTIEATGDVAIDHAEQQETYASIGRITIGPWEEAAGFTGNLIALRGRIGQIYSTGPIGTSTTAANIIAANGIREIRAGTATSSSILARDFNANINAAADPSSSAFPTYDGSLWNLTTDGLIAGSIQAKNLSFDSTVSGLGGIVTRGPITASIAIENNLLDTNIIGSSITGPVWIGWMAQGCIVATGVDESDPNAGHINSLQIGYGGASVLYQYYYRPGLVGSYCPPVQVPEPAHWYNGQCAGGGTSDSVVHAQSIGLLRVSSMAQLWGRDIVGEFVVKSEVPRIEAATISELEIGDMRAGVVWSGQLEYENDVVENDEENDYSAISELTIGCVGPGAAVWFFGCERANLLHDVFGELHLPLLAADETIWIGDRLGIGPAVNTQADLEYCACGSQVEAECFYTSGSHSEDSPRDTNYAAKGKISIRDGEGLAGQIIINGAHSPEAEEFWSGIVEVGSVMLSMSQDQPYRAPYYTLPSSEVGGGAVGLAPFAFYPTDCTPEHEVGDPLMYTEFEDGVVAVVARWYGPVELPVGEEFEEYPSLAALLNLHCKAPGSSCDWYLLDAMFNYVKHPAGQKRAIGIKAQGDAIPKDGLYRLSYESQSEARLVSDDVAESPFVGVFPTGCALRGYLFTVDADCDGNSIPDSIDIATGGLDEFDLPVLDQNENGILDDCEAVVQNCDADWCGDGIVAVADIFCFLADWFALDEDARTYGGATTPVQAIFLWLAVWFATLPGPCES